MPFIGQLDNYTKLKVEAHLFASIDQIFMELNLVVAFARMLTLSGPAFFRVSHGPGGRG